MIVEEFLALSLDGGRALLFENRHSLFAIRQMRQQSKFTLLIERDEEG